MLTHPAALPPPRPRCRAANREKFQVAARVKPESFCEVQMDTYLRASAFRQQLEEYKQQLGGGGDGPQVGCTGWCCVWMCDTAKGLRLQ